MIGLNDIQGHWVRDWIKAPGFEDHTTRVHWMQAGLDYADVRIPMQRPDLGNARCLAELDAATLRKLAQAEGFAGHVALHGDKCTWHREVNWHGSPHALDVGAISFDAEGRMIEAGVQAEYTELWEQRATVRTNVLRFGDGIYSGFLVICGPVGVVGIGQNLKPASAPVLEALDAEQVPQEAAVLFDGMHALCHFSDGSVMAELCTDPFLEGHPVLTLRGDIATWHKVGFDGARTDVALQIETVPA